jgi:2-keto-3-deoxy-L-arabinonate dehydratase
MPLTKPLTGILPVAPTPFHADGRVDEEGMRRVIDCMIDQGVDAICILANYSEQFLLSDEERALLMRVIASNMRRAACRSSSPSVISRLAS